MKIAFIGTHGIPATYGGFETFVEQTAIRLVKYGHEVTVYNRSGHHSEKLKKYHDVGIVALPCSER